MIKIKGMLGLGDSIYMRPVVRELAKKNKVCVVTPWPELFNDLDGVFSEAPVTPLRTQANNIKIADYSKKIAGRVTQTIPLRYKSNDIKNGVTILQSLAACADVKLPSEIDMSLPDWIKGPVKGRLARTAFVRPVTLRAEWLNSARAPLPSYIATVTKWLNDAGYKTFGVADLCPKKEWLVPPAPPVTVDSYNWLNTIQLLYFASVAPLMVGGVGFIVPLSLATKTPLFCVLGGNGAYNRPEILLDPRVDGEHIGWAKPDRFCECMNDRHECDKKISGLREKFLAWKVDNSL